MSEKNKTMGVRCYRDPLALDVDVCVRNQWISQAAYGEVVEKMIIPCTDVVFYIEGDQAIYLGKRSVFPMKGIWCIGGRIFFNDRSTEESIVRCVELETGLRISADRFVFNSSHLYSWVKVAQGDFAGKNLGLTYVCAVTEAEVKQMAHGLAATEYDVSFGLQRFDRSRLVDAGVHQAMIDVYDDLFSKK